MSLNHLLFVEVTVVLLLLLPFPQVWQRLGMVKVFVCAISCSSIQLQPFVIQPLGRQLLL